MYESSGCPKTFERECKFDKGHQDTLPRERSRSRSARSREARSEGTYIVKGGHGRWSVAVSTYQVCVTCNSMRDTSRSGINGCTGMPVEWFLLYPHARVASNFHCRVLTPILFLGSLISKQRESTCESSKVDSSYHAL